MLAYFYSSFASDLSRISSDFYPVKLLFHCFDLFFLLITFWINSNGSHETNSAITLMTSTINPQIYWATESSTISPISSVKRPSIASYDSDHFT